MPCSDVVKYRLSSGGEVRHWYSEYPKRLFPTPNPTGAFNWWQCISGTALASFQQLQKVYKKLLRHVSRSLPNPKSERAVLVSRACCFRQSRRGREVVLRPSRGGRQLFGAAQLKFPAFRRYLRRMLTYWRYGGGGMQGRTPNEEKLTEDEIGSAQKAQRTSRHSGRRGYCENDTATEKEFAKGRRIRRPRCVGGEWAAIAAVPGSGWLHRSGKLLSSLFFTSPLPSRIVERRTASSSCSTEFAVLAEGSGWFRSMTPQVSCQRRGVAVE